MKTILKVIATIFLFFTMPLVSLAHKQDKNGAMYLESYQSELIEAAKTTKLLADQGNADAQYNMGVYYFYGDGVEQNYQQSFDYFKLAAAQGNIDAQYNLGELYYLGRGTAQNYKESARITKILADKNDVDALIHLAMLYKKGIVYPKDTNMTVKYLELAAKQNSDYAEYSLGKLYEEGVSINQNYTLAAKYYKLASLKKFSKAQKKLARLYLEGLGVIQNKQKAKDLLKLAEINKEKDSSKTIRMYKMINTTDQNKEDFSILYKILTLKEWELFQVNGYFEGSQMDNNDGFIHAAFEDQYPNIIKKFFIGIKPLILVKIDQKLLVEESLKIESNKPGGIKYPHIYKNISFKAVISHEIIN